jgi:hypothetical protein
MNRRTRGEAVQCKASVCSGLTAVSGGSFPAEGMEIRLLGLLCVVQVAASVTGRSLVQRCATRGVSVCDLETSAVRRPRPDLCHCATEKERH